MLSTVALSVGGLFMLIPITRNFIAKRFLPGKCNYSGKRERAECRGVFLSEDCAGSHTASQEAGVAWYQPSGEASLDMWRFVTASESRRLVSIAHLLLSADT